MTANYGGLVLPCQLHFKGDDCYVADAFKNVPMLPNGLFDARSSADALTAGSLSWVQNFELTPDGKRKTASGFAKPYGKNLPVGCPYQHADFNSNGGASLPDREPPTLLFYSTSNAGVRQLYLGTKTRLFVLNEAAGTWTLLSGAPSFGQDGSDILTSTRFHAAQLQDNLVFVNGLDDVYYTDVTTTALTRLDALDGAGVDGADVSAPAVIIQWSGVLLIMNIKEGSTRFASRIRWSDLNDALWWKATTNPHTSLGSIVDYQDLDYGDRILAAIPLLGFLYVFTNRSIYRCNFTVDATQTPPLAALNCVRIYSEPKNEARCLAYPNTLVSDGESLYWASRDSIYRYNSYMASPERTEYIYRASFSIFDDTIPIDATSCQAPVAEYFPDRKEIYFSWSVADAVLVNPPPGCDVLPPAVSSGINSKTLVINTLWNSCDIRDFGMTVYANFTSDLSASGQCNAKKMFLGASGIDFCLKEFNIGNAREYYNPTTTLYTLTGYTADMIWLFALPDPSKEKEIKQFTVDAQIDTNVGNLFEFSIGQSYTSPPVPFTDDSGNCGIVWSKLSPKPIKCLMAYTPIQYAGKRLSPSLEHRWNFLYKSRFLFGRLRVTDSAGNPPKFGSATLFTFSAMAIEA